MSDDAKTFTVENAQLIFKNFSGAEKQYNAAGKRNFCVILPHDFAAVLAGDGWPVKMLDAYDEGDEDTPYIQVTVGYKVRPPKVVMITSRSRTPLDEETINVLDWASMGTVDLIARAYDWNVNGKEGRKPYLQTMFVTIEEDELERKYATDGPADI